MSAAGVDVVTGWTAALLVALPGAAALAASALFAGLRARLARKTREQRAALSVDPFALKPGAVSIAGLAEPFDGQTALSPAFLLKLESGVRVRVEAERVELQAGARVFVRGVLRGLISPQPNAERATLQQARLSAEAFDGTLERRVDELGGLAVVLLVTAIATQVVYAGFYWEALLHVLGRGGPPTVVIAIYFWVALISGSVILGATLSAMKRQ